ncbi:YPDG domain-containing protein, partial [Streptococcus suis]
MYFNRKGSQQTGWRMIKKGKQVVFGCSLLLAVGAATTFATSATVAAAETPATEATAEQVAPEATAPEAAATEPAVTEEAATETTDTAGVTATATDATLRAVATTSNVDPVPADGQTFASDALPTPEQLIKNAAELQASGATISYKEAPAVGKGYAVITVTYADGSVREVTVLVTVNDTTKQELVQDAVPSGTEQDDAQSTVNGYVTYNRSGNPNNLNEDNAPRMEGVTVYAQWFERDGSASPVYSAVTGADGSYHIIMKPFIKADGSTAQFDADALLPEGEKFRIWAQNPDPSKYDLLFQYMNGQVGPETAIFDTGGGASYDLGPNRLNRVHIQFVDAKDPEKMHDIAKAVETPKDGLNGNVEGTVIWNNRVPAGALDYGTLSLKNNGDVPVIGITMYGSYLSDAAIAKIMTEAPAAIGSGKVRGLGWTDQNEADLQAWIQEQIAIDGKDFWIAETVSSVTDANGKYTLQFNGTYGTSWDNVGTFADANANALKGTVADSPSAGRWATSAGGSSRIGSDVSKHINKDWLFISTEKLDGISQITDWRNNWYKPASGNFGVTQPLYTSTNGADFALYPEQIIFDVTPYDSFNNFAAPGETAIANVDGLPNAFAGNQQYAIEWTDSKGNVVVAATPVNVLTDGTIPSVPFTVPADLVGTETYTAKLYSVGTDGKIGDVPLAQDSFTANADRQNVVNEPSYDMTLVTPGTPATSTPTFTDKDANEVTPPAGTKFEIPADYTAPEGYTVTIDENTGVVTVEAPSTLTASTVESFEVPVKVTYPDNSVDETVAPFQLDTDGDGTPDVTDTDDDNDGVTDQEEKDNGTNPKAENQNGLFDPSYDNTLVTPGTPATSTPVIKDKDGNPTTAPEGTKFEIPSDYTAPEGYIVTIDEKTGVVTVTAPDNPNGDTAEEINVPVLVTYPDGSTDPVTAPFQLDTDGDGTPDVTDTDDDNDGVTDTDEINNGTNPKAENQNGLFDPSYDNTLVTPGTPATSTPVIKDKDGNPTTAPEGTKFEIPSDFTPPAGYTVEIDPKTGTVTITAPEKPNGETAEEIDVPVLVTYPDETTDSTTAPFQLDTDGDGTPDVKDEDDDNDGFTDEEEKTAGTNPKDSNSKPTVDTTTDADNNDPKYTDGSGEPGTEVKVPAPTNPDGTPVPDGSTFVSDNPAIVVDPKTGEVTVTIPEDATPGTVIDGTITITYPDGSTDEVPVKVTVKDPNATDADNNDPKYTDGSGEPGTEVKVPAPTNPDGTPVPDGSTFVSDNPAIVVDPKTGEVTVTIPEDATPGTVIDGTITITYPDGSTDEVPVKVTVKDPNATDADNNDPKYTDGSGEPGTEVKVPAPTNPDGTPVPDGSKFESDNPAIVVDPNTGEVTVTIPEDATPGTVIDGTIT